MGPVVTRRADWEKRLRAAVREAAKAEFRWGSRDCCLWVAAVVQELTGADFGRPYRGRYATRRQALSILARDGGPAGIATAALGAPKPPALAARGDVVLWRGDGDCLGIVVDDRFAAMRAGAGLVFLPLEHAVMAWSV